MEEVFFALRSTGSPRAAVFSSLAALPAAIILAAMLVYKSTFTIQELLPITLPLIFIPLSITIPQRSRQEMHELAISLNVGSSQ